MFNSLENITDLPVPTEGKTELIEDVLVLTDQGKKDLTDAYCAGKSVIQTKHDLKIHLHLVKSSYAKKEAIETHCIQLMNSEDAPTTISELKTEAKKEFPDCSLVPFEYNIDKIIECSKKDGSGDWDFYKTNIIVQTNS